MSEDPSVTTNCWSTVGVWGTHHQPRCDKLAQVIHCRNCDVFKKAGRTLFEKAVMDGELAYWTDQIAQIKKEIDKTDLSILTFRLGDVWLALPTLIYSQISPVGYTHKIPHKTAESGLKLTNVSGVLYVSVCLSRFLGLNEFKSTQTDRNMLVSFYGSNYVFQTNEIGGVYRVDSANLKTVESATINTALLKETINVANRPCLLLDESALAANIRDHISGVYE